MTNQNSPITDGGSYRVAARRLVEMAAVKRDLNGILNGAKNHRATLATIFAETGYPFGGTSQFMNLTAPNWVLDVMFHGDGTVRHFEFSSPEQPSIIV